MLFNSISMFFLKKKISHYVFSFLSIAVVGLVCTPLSNTQNYHVVSFVLLFVVSLLATYMTLGPVLLASTLSALVWNFFFIPPSLTFHIDKAEDILMFSMFFIIALLNGVLTTKVRKQEKLAIEREERTDALFKLSSDLSKARGINEVLSVAILQIKTNFNIYSRIILQNGEGKLISEEYNKERVIGDEEFEVAEKAFKDSIVIGRYTELSPDSVFTFFPLQGIRINPGVIAVRIDKDFLDNQKDFWITFLTLISNALEREYLGEMAQKLRFLNESDRLYKTLFNSISHELRIPVATIMGASDTLIDSSYKKEAQDALHNEIFTASIRLNRLIENLLNMSRLESGHISIHIDWHDINDLINKVVDDLKVELKGYHLNISISENMPLVKIDFGLMEQVLYNLLHNVTQHTPVDNPIDLIVMYNENNLIIQIGDYGQGFPENALNDIFNKFYKINTNKKGGIGLGLSIVKGFIDAHKGDIWVENKKTNGALFTIKIPSEYPPISHFNTV